ncbi:MAG: hypothetical protein IAI49_13285 [Candidatus Eremiobacteraeota bacterium]|nr:hypothetical protein [Candidatus Eremiobacteraeota bacterium]
MSDRAQTAQTAIANALPLDEGVRNPLPLLIGSLIGGLAVGLLVPLSALEKERLQPVGDEIVRRASEARSEVIAQSRAVVTETVSAAKESVQTHSREAAENLGVADA